MRTSQSLFFSCAVLTLLAAQSMAAEGRVELSLTIAKGAPLTA